MARETSRALANLEAGQARHRLLGDLKLDTSAPPGPLRQNSTMASTCSVSPSKTASTAPSPRFVTQPATPSSAARRRPSPGRRRPGRGRGPRSASRIRSATPRLPRTRRPPGRPCRPKSSSAVTAGDWTGRAESAASPSLAIEWSVAGGIRTRSPGRSLGVARDGHRPAAAHHDVDLLGLLVGVELLLDVPRGPRARSPTCCGSRALPRP